MIQFPDIVAIVLYLTGEVPENCATPAEPMSDGQGHGDIGAPPSALFAEIIVVTQLRLGKGECMSMLGPRHQSWEDSCTLCGSLASPSKCLS